MTEFEKQFLESYIQNINILLFANFAPKTDALVVSISRNIYKLYLEPHLKPITNYAKKNNIDLGKASKIAITETVKNLENPKLSLQQLLCLIVVGIFTANTLDKKLSLKHFKELKITLDYIKKVTGGYSADLFFINLSEFALGFTKAFMYSYSQTIHKAEGDKDSPQIFKKALISGLEDGFAGMIARYAKKVVVGQIYSFDYSLVLGFNLLENELAKITKSSESYTHQLFKPLLQSLSSIVFLEQEQKNITNIFLNNAITGSKNNRSKNYEITYYYPNQDYISVFSYRALCIARQEMFPNLTTEITQREQSYGQSSQSLLATPKYPQVNNSPTLFELSSLQSSTNRQISFNSESIKNSMWTSQKPFLASAIAIFAVYVVSICIKKLPNVSHSKHANKSKNVLQKMQ